MSLNTLTFSVKGDAGAALKAPVHHGVVGSGDMEVLMEPKAQDGAVSVSIVTPVAGFDDLWKRVLQTFVSQSGLSDAHLDINDNNATPAVVLLRLRQAMTEAQAN
ncbi:malonate decarboxylase acyl carrier protein [Roseospira marina]|uniref:Malonate decarboxylase acyl carrier protein n=1 Tax=Roseospira marina TaxID=140057 RepID=A0A5M6ICY1_9PROT|nr:malonate decarboxylase acyl carrier protein [Roseospira marina]KAA5606134.1 malonate decarboxylase acyl carrier protein [Roseospira marina]MBB4314272.1 malonate decarboxylase delta subunit [Roseospira marina]MBB5087432.1 malonate decarboxylase delta subunit [Roseospira marina]